MSRSFDIVVVGAGPAGVSAAVEAAGRGASVLLVEQRPFPGGAIHRAARDGGPSAAPMPARHKKNWAALQRQLQDYSTALRPDGAAGARNNSSGSATLGLSADVRASAQGRGSIHLLTSAVFLGIDGDGVCMIDSRADGQVKLARPKAVIFATGATERVPHVPGWELPGVVTAGGLQVQLKESGEAPRGRILIAGNGPLPLALGAQLAALGNAPVAVLEAAQPFRNACSQPLAALSLLAGPRQLLEAASYFRGLRAAKVPYRTGTSVSAVQRNETCLSVQTRDQRGRTQDYQVDVLVLHGGLACNDRGIPVSEVVHGIVIAKAGDCNRVLGTDAALTEGRRVAALVMGRLNGQPAQADTSGASRAAAFQKAVWQLYEHGPQATGQSADGMDTVLCRCEGVTRRMLAERDLHSPREVRLVGRIGMGLCQGRFCAHAATMAGEDAGIGLADIDGPVARWPIRPVSVKALAQAKEL
jgi:NADPH-dependent 2,4-dienoyl-CoA reductase/sulfur reductase-like enzyme